MLFCVIERSIKYWKISKETLTDKVERLILSDLQKENQKLSTLRGEISSVENIHMRVELMTAEQSMKTKNKQAEI